MSQLAKDSKAGIQTDWVTPKCVCSPTAQKVTRQRSLVNGISAVIKCITSARESPEREEKTSVLYYSAAKLCSPQGVYIYSEINPDHPS